MPPKPVEPIRASLPDRLTAGGAPATPRDLRDGLRRDLERLLNTRWRCTSWPPDLSQLDRSVVNYGIPDFSDVSFSDPASQNTLRAIIEKAIRTFEPRFRSVKVVLDTRFSRGERTLRFRVEAQLIPGLEPDAITFETALDMTTSTYRVRPIQR